MYPFVGSSHFREFAKRENNLADSPAADTKSIDRALEANNLSKLNERTGNFHENKGML
jgi:hypothetical protein